MDSADKKRIFDHAEQGHDMKLMRALCDIPEYTVWDYLRETFIDIEGIGTSAIDGRKKSSKRRVGVSFKSNARRREQLAKWIEDEESIKNPTQVQKTILELYRKEAALLDEYANLLLLEYLNLN